MSSPSPPLSNKLLSLRVRTESLKVNPRPAFQLLSEQRLPAFGARHVAPFQNRHGDEGTTAGGMAIEERHG